MRKLSLEKVSKRNILNLHFKCQQHNNVQTIRLYSLVSWNFYVPDNFKIYASTEVSERSRLQHWKTYRMYAKYTLIVAMNPVAMNPVAIKHILQHEVDTGY